MGCIYMATCTVNGKKYIGQTWHFERRKNEHRWGRKAYAFSSALRKYGAASFTWKILLDGILIQEELNAAEAALIRRHRTLAPHGYNLLAGDQREKRSGVAAAHHLEAIRKLTSTPEWKARNAAQLKRMFAHPDWKKKHDSAMARNPSNPHWRLKHAEMVAKISKSVFCIETGAAFKSSKDAERRTGTDSSSIIAVCRGRRKTAGGNHWRYAA
jgi:group I intron endonuclease